jgi:hypothetical protein
VLVEWGDTALAALGGEPSLVVRLAVSGEARTAVLEGPRALASSPR